MATTVAALAGRARRDIQHHFFSRDAVRPDRAVPFEPSSGIERRIFERMRTAGIIHEPGAGCYWLDLVAYDAEQVRRHRILKAVLLVVLLLFAVTMATQLLHIGA